MNNWSYRFIAGLSLLLVGLAQADPGPMRVSFTVPGITPSLTDNPDNDLAWYTTALPVGNGKLGAMIYGGVGTENVQFNEDTIWSGQVHDYTNPNTTTNRLGTIRTNCFNRVDILSDEQSYVMSRPWRLPEYQAPGVLVLTFPHSGQANYLRSLDLNSATVNVHYDYGGVTFNRDYFASAPSNRVIVIHFTASQSAKVAFSCSFATKQTVTVNTNGNDLVMHARVTAIGDSRYFDGSSGFSGLTNAIRYDARVRLIASNGTVTMTSSSISVTNADDVTLLLAVASNCKTYNDLSADYVNICSNNIAAAAALGYPGLRQAQQSDYTNLFNRVVLDLGGNSRTNLDIGTRKKQLGTDGNDPQLIALVFQMGRYLTIAGSRPGSEALNLQGRWNNSTNMFATWGSKMTLNINEELNYSGTEAANLSECTQPLFDLIKDLSVTGHEVAQSNYFSDGWTAHHNTDLWRNAGAVNGNDGIWPTGGAWLCQHLWWHYQYTGDTNWLATNGYPAMKGAAQFFEDFLIPHRTNANWLVTCPSYSPEHNWQSGSTQVANVPGPTMDNELIRDLFNHVIAASQILGVDFSFRTNITALRDKLPPERIGQYGQLQEWIEDIDANPDGHRHCSHLVGLSPGDEISPFYTPVVARAARVSVDFRGDAILDTPWSRAVRINLRDRLQDGEHAFLNLTNLLCDSKVSTNLVFGDGSVGKNKQLDWVFGSVSGIAEMFLQSQSGEVFLLPALPSKLTNGMVSGLCARGGFEVDNMTWSNGQFTGATILSKIGNVCNLRSKWPIIVKQGGNLVTAPMVLPGLYQFSTAAGSNYTVSPANIAEAENLSATTSGATQQAVTNAAFSNWRGAQFNATAAGNSVTYAVSNLAAGNYHLYITANAGANCGQFQLACGPIGGALANVGSAQDTYSPTNMAYLLPIKITTTTNLIVLWTNMQREFDCGNWTAPSNGNYNFKFTVTGKNAASTGYALTLDYIKFAPAVVTPPPNQPPLAPTNLAPASAAANQSVAPTLQSTAFLDPDNGDTQAASEWLVWRASDNALIFDSGTDTVDTISFTLPANSLDYGATYNWQTRHKDNHGAWSGYSTTTSFSTTAPMLNSGAQAGGLVFCWPTNSAGFVLQCTTNLFPPNWVPAAITPAIVNGFYTVTNPPDSGTMFFRLDKP